MPVIKRVSRSKQQGNVLGLLTIAISLLAIYLVLAPKKIDYDERQLAKTAPKSKVGVLKATSSSGGDRNKTTAVLMEDGTRFTVRGEYGVVKPGDDVSTSIVKLPEAKTSATFICIQEQCKRVVE